MTNLPISSHKPQPCGNAANALQANIAADSLATDTQSAGPFAFLLAQQIGEADLSVLTTVQTAIPIDDKAAGGNAEPALKDTQDQAALAANTPSDPANTLVAILLQLPALEDRGQEADGRQATQSFTLGSIQGGEHRRQATGSESSQIIQPLAIGPLLPGADKRAELPADLAQPSSTNTAQAVASLAISATMPGMLTNNMPAGTPQIIAPPLGNTIATPLGNTIATPLGNNGWADEFSQKISWISTQQNQVAELHLNPPNLGPLDVVLKISDNQATALFTSPHGAVRDAVENALPKLREILADNGIMLGNTTISDQSPRDRSAEGFMNQGSGTAAKHEISAAASEPAGSTPATAQTVPVRRHNGMVDTFA